MLAYHSDKTIKTGIVAQLKRHREADELVKGRYWEGGKGCAVGCTIHSGNHSDYEKLFGIPTVLAKLEDHIFEGLCNAKAQEWPVKFMSAIRPGADLANVWPQFAAWLMTDKKSGVLRFAKTDEQRAIIQEVAQLYERGEKNFSVWQDVRSRAMRISNADAAADAADAAADAADAAAAARRRRAGGVGAAPSSSAASAARSLPHETPRQQHYSAQADQLIKLLKAA